jgi:alpha-tubulin suppressor-like RCC1 family protein
MVLDFVYNMPPVPRGRSLAAGDTHFLKVQGDGSAWAWGSNANGELGVGHNDPTTEPAETVNLQNKVKDVAGGWGFSCWVCPFILVSRCALLILCSSVRFY